MPPPAPPTWDGVERRKPNSCRRKAQRRTMVERRLDRREAKGKHRRGLLGFLRSLFFARLGVDRRKTADRRVVADRRSSSPRAMLTKEELADLLK